MTQLKVWANRLPYLMRPGPALGFDLVRAYLGIGLFVRGVLFVSRPELVIGYLSSTESWFVPYAMAHYVALAHLGGGLLLAFGLATRLAAFVQLPVLVGAVFMVHSGDSLLTAGQSLEFSALVLMLLIVYLAVGAGPLSVDAWLGDRVSLLGGESQQDLQPATVPGRALSPMASKLV
ncbi:MAG TPA: DoxX family protein [Polyangiaceae bacterium]|nr:DoxX family protein [Polyangiaceae bacterium]